MTESLNVKWSKKSTQGYPVPRDATAIERLRLATVILDEIVKRWDNLKRDEGAFPTGDRRAAMSEHRLWHEIQNAKAFLTPLNR